MPFISIQPYEQGVLDQFPCLLKQLLALRLIEIRKREGGEEGLSFRVFGKSPRVHLYQEGGSAVAVERPEDRQVRNGMSQKELRGYGEKGKKK